MKNIFFTTLLLICLALGNAHSEPFNNARLDSLFDILAAKNKAMGSIAISKNGNIIYSRAIGYKQISDKEKQPVTTSTKYRIGSITKMFTATMIFQLIDEGKIKLTTPIATYFPKLPNAGKITIGNLLNHRSGLHNFTNDEDYMTWMTSPKTHDEMLDIISKKPVDFEPNEKASYSNSNYVLLGYVIENITKQTYSKALQERITSKIGLSDTYVGGKINLTHNECFSYAVLGDWELQPETDMSIPGGAGAIISTPTDLTKFIEALFAQKLMSEKSFSQMKTITDSYGMGIFTIPFNTRKAYGHNGGIDGFASILGYFPEDSVAISYISNGQAYPMNDILIGALSIYFDMDYSIPTFTVIAVKPEELDKYRGVYSSPQFPLKITIAKEGSTLTGQATGQSSFPLEATEKDKFEFQQAGIVIEFNTTKSELTLKQGGRNFVLKKE